MGLVRDLRALVGRAADRLARLGPRYAALIESEQRYKSLFDHNPDAVYSLDLDGRFTSMNAAGAGLGGRADLIGVSFSDVVHPDDLHRVAGHFVRTCSGEPQSYECRFLAADGSEVPLHVTNSAVVVDGQVVGAFGVVKDMTARMQAEHRLAVSKQRYKALYDRNPDAVYSLDLHGRFLSGNEACLALTGYEPLALSRVPVQDIIDPAQRTLIQKNFDRALAGESVDYECVMLRRDGARVHLRVINIPVLVDGDIVSVYGIAKDVTARRELEAELRRQARCDALTQLPKRRAARPDVAAPAASGPVAAVHRPRPLQGRQRLARPRHR